MDAVAEGAHKHLLATAETRLRELCAISSESGNSEGIRKAASYIGAELHRHGMRVEIVDEPDAGGVKQPVLIARGPTTGDRHLLLLGHMDTVLPAIKPEVEQRRLFATGALDMKGGLAMLLGALDLLAARGQQYPDDTLVVLVPDEESESFISGAAAKRWSEDARAVLVLEPGQVCEKGETLVAGRRGLTEWSLEVTGRAAHSGLAYWAGHSALAAAAEWSAQAQALSQHGPGPTVNVARLVAGGADFVGELGLHHEMLGSSRQRNVVSDRAIAEGEIRFLSAADGPATLDALARLAERIARKHEVTAKFNREMTVAPVDPHGPGAPLVRRTVELAAARGFHLEVEADRGGISFPNFIADPTTTPVVDGLGPTGDGMHVRGEYLNLDSLARRIVLLADLLATL
jgi:glutamate carboxypeptidase